MIKHVYIETYGCTANQNNSELIKARIVESGLDIVGNPKIADLFIINTCIVKGKIENRIVGRLKELSKLNKPIILTGCIVPVRFRELKDKKDIYLLSLNNLKSIARLIREINDKRYVFDDFNSKSNEIKLGRKLKENRYIGITQISEGCLNSCSYCITKKAKGGLFNFPEQRILEQVKNDLKAGSKEIWLTSQDNASYGLPEKPKLIDLLGKILEMKHKFRVRLGMMNPENVLPILGELIEIYKNKKMYKFLHLPVQSASNKVLRDMGRKYKIKDFLEIVSKFKKEIPEITLATDIIAGYPTESKQDFQQTISLLKQVKPEIINLSRFWPRRGTKAATLKQIDVKTQIKRTSEIMKLHRSFLPRQNYAEQEALFTERQGDLYFGRLLDYKRVIVSCKRNLLGRFAKIRAKEVKGNYLVCEEV